MPRSGRIVLPGYPHHIVQRGHNSQPVFTTPNDFHYYLDSINRWKEEYGVRLYGYCLMTNHVHLILQPEDTLGLGDLMKRVAGRQTRRFNRLHERRGTLWEGRFKSSPIDTDAYLLCVVRYIHRNALDVRGVEAVDRYRWSSLRAYLGLRPTPAFLDTSVVLEYFDGDVAAFARFTHNDAGVAVTTPDDLVQLVRWASIRDDLRRNKSEPTPEWQERTALTLLVDRLEPVAPRLAAELDEMLAYPTGDARRMARCTLFRFVEFD